MGLLGAFEISTHVKKKTLQLYLNKTGRKNQKQQQQQKTLIFRAVLGLWQIEGKVQSGHISSTLVCTAFPTINILHQSGTFVTVDEPTLTHHHPKSIVYIRVHSWCCTFCGF